MPAIARAGENSDLWRRALELGDLLLSWAELTPALVLNRPSAMASNDSKPCQSSWIESLGFRIPETLITTDPAAAGQFCEEHERVIYKSISGVRSIVTRVTYQHLAKLDDVVFCPTQFQEYIPGMEYRVHVVGDKIFASAIRSEADDYRYASENVQISACEIPSEIGDRCRNLAASMKLTLAGIDLRCTPEGTWYCFEVNPSPGFNTYEECTGQPIAQAVARLLSSGRRA